MAITSYPFESLNTGTETEPVFDRAITAEDERLFNKMRYTNGVFASVGDALKVTANNNMTVTIGIGGGHIEGALFYNTAPITLKIDAASATLNRIDRVVAQFNTSVSVRAVSIAVRAGVAATNPVAPELRRESNFYEIALADISVKKGVTSISTSAITDQRLNNELCGEVIAAIPTPVDTTDLWDQYQASLNEWLGTVAAALDETLAGNLQNQITALEEDINTVKQNSFELNPTQTIPSNADLNDYTDFGCWLCPSTAVSKTLKNCPLNNQGFSLRVMRGTSNAYRVQEIIAGLGGRIYRHYTGTTWSKWITDADAAISAETIQMFEDAGYPIE